MSSYGSDTTYRYNLIPPRSNNYPDCQFDHWMEMVRDEVLWRTGVDTRRWGLPEWRSYYANNAMGLSPIETANNLITSHGWADKGTRVRE